MMKPTTLLFLFTCLLASQGFSQTSTRQQGSAGFSLGLGTRRSNLSLDYAHLWKFGKGGKYRVGLGTRWNTFFGSRLVYITAPGELTSGSSSPLIIFKENIAANIDTVTFRKSAVHSLNIAIHLEYEFTSKIRAGFNIDAIGFSFGPKQRGKFETNSALSETSGTPTPFNILLISDNDRGSLNSEFYAEYALTPRWSLRASAQFLFTEYTTVDKVQQFPKENDRFRNKALLGAVAIRYTLY